MEAKFYRYNGIVSEDYQKIEEMVSDNNPEILDVDWEKFFNNNVEKIEFLQCSECNHEVVEVEWTLSCRATRFQPAEYDGRATCKICGAQFEYDDSPADAEITEL